MRWIPTSAALLALLTGCFYTEVINERPIPGIRSYVDGPYFVGTVLRFDATKTIDDTTIGHLAEWQAFTCEDGQSPRCLLFDEKIGDLDDRFIFTIPDHRDIEVQLRVTDPSGATRLQPDIFSVPVGNAEPRFDVQVTGHKESAGGAFILYRGINLLAITTDGLTFDPDNDPVSFSWELLPPPMSQSSARSFEPEGDTGYTLHPDVPGQWGVVVTADDGFGGETEVRKDFFVDTDDPPCLQALDPQAVDDAYYLVDSADGPRRFSVLSVKDTLDPFPAAIDPDPVLGESEFQWFLQEPGSSEFAEIVGHQAADYLVDPAVYNPGDQLALRVEVRDRVQGPERELVCADDVWSCSLEAGSNCFQRRSWGVDIR